MHLDTVHLMRENKTVIHSVCDMNVLIQTTPNLQMCGGCVVVVLYVNSLVVRAVQWVLVRMCGIFTLCKITTLKRGPVRLIKTC